MKNQITNNENYFLRQISYVNLLLNYFSTYNFEHDNFDDERVTSKTSKQILIKFAKI